MNDTQLRFDGWLGSDDRFEPIPGWETDDPIRAETGDGGYRLVVRDADGARLAAVTPRTRTGTSCSPGTKVTPRRTRITGYVPLVAGAHTVALVDTNGTLFARPIGDAPPSVEITAFDRTNDEFTLEWDSDLPQSDAGNEDEETAAGDSARQLTHHVGVIADGAVTPLAFDRAERSLEGSLEHVPGDDHSRLLVVATDGLRSATAETEPIEIDDPGPTVTIQRPGDGDVAPADHPISLAGQVQDAHGRSHTADGMIWRMDGDVVARDAAVAMVHSPGPGEHTVALTYDPAENGDMDVNDPVTRELRVTVQERSDRQQWYHEVMPPDRAPNRMDT